MSSVVITTHNRWRKLEKPAASMAAQTLAPNELIVIDDSSIPAVDATRLAALALSLALHVIRRDRPRGPGGARNEGTAAARQGAMAFLVDDKFEHFKLVALPHRGALGDPTPALLREAGIAGQQAAHIPPTKVRLGSRHRLTRFAIPDPPLGMRRKPTPGQQARPTWLLLPAHSIAMVAP